MKKIFPQIKFSKIIVYFDILGKAPDTQTIVMKQH